MKNTSRLVESTVKFSNLPKNILGVKLIFSLRVEVCGFVRKTGMKQNGGVHIGPFNFTLMTVEVSGYERPLSVS